MPSRHHVPIEWKIQDELLRAIHKLETSLKKIAKHRAAQQRKAARHAASVAKHASAHGHGRGHGGGSSGGSGASHRGQFQDSRGTWIGDKKRYHNATNKKGHRYGGRAGNPQYYTDPSEFDPGYYSTPYGDVTIGNGWNPYAATHVDGTGHVLPGPGAPPPSVWGGLGPSPYGGVSLSATHEDGSNGGAVRHRARHGAATTSGHTHHATPHPRVGHKGHAAKRQHLPSHAGGGSHRRHANHPGVIRPRQTSSPHGKRKQA